MDFNKALHLVSTTADFESFAAERIKLKITFSDWPRTPGKISLRTHGAKKLFFQDADSYSIEVNIVAQN